jgi:hypothetical protein
MAVSGPRVTSSLSKRQPKPSLSSHNITVFLPSQTTYTIGFSIRTFVMPSLNISLPDCPIDANQAAHDDQYDTGDLQSPSRSDSKSEHSSSSKATSKASTKKGEHSTEAQQEKEKRSVSGLCVSPLDLLLATHSILKDSCALPSARTLFPGLCVSPLDLLLAIHSILRDSCALPSARTLFPELCVSPLDLGTTLSPLPHILRGVVDCHLSVFFAHDMFALPHPVSPWCSRPQDRGKHFTIRTT